MSLATAISRLKERERQARVALMSETASVFGRCPSALVFVLVAVSLVATAALLSVEISSSHRTFVGSFALLPLLVAMRLFSPRLAMAYGALWGAGLFGFLAFPSSRLVPVTAGSLILLAMAPALYAYAMVWLARRYGFNPWMLAFGWGFVELALTPLGLHGGLLGSTAGLASGSFLHVLQGVLGYVCVAALIVGVNAVVLALIGRAYRRVCGATRLVRSSSRIPRRIFPLEVPLTLSFVPGFGRPRAPPIRWSGS